MEKNFEHLVSPVIQRDILEVPTQEILAAAGRGLILDRLRLCPPIDSTSPEERAFIEQLQRVIVE